MGNVRGTTARTSVTLAIGDLSAWMRGELQHQLFLLARDIVEEATLEGEDHMKEIIETSVTKTGEKRAESGGHPGRIDSGDMIDAVQSNVDLIGQSRIEGSWGFEREGEGLDPYFLYQNYGTADIEAMNALRDSYIGSRELLLGRLEQAGLDVK